MSSTSNLISLRNKHGDGDDEGQELDGEGFIEVRVEGGMRRLLWATHVDSVTETDHGCLVVYNNDPLPLVIHTSYDDVKKLLKEFFYVAVPKAKRT